MCQNAQPSNAQTDPDQLFAVNLSQGINLFDSDAILPAVVIYDLCRYTEISRSSFSKTKSSLSLTYKKISASNHNPKPKPKPKGPRDHHKMCWIGPVQKWCQRCNTYMGRFAYGRTLCDRTRSENGCSSYENTSQEMKSVGGNYCNRCLQIMDYMYRRERSRTWSRL